ncbi:hypothetical protein Cfor_06749 [Coptotermes formosanus]|uniref:Ionotropic glutamate receptor C-terminal domain-containing protein n=1 Tax=Coptotermes formosanus TaxID=36987 RepID=A0A6L2PXR6_COPFO|nr:hypothetical protein Cfor_06749 [Coptotermes formosanus]
MLALLHCHGRKYEQNDLVSLVVNIAERNFLPNQTLLISSTGQDDANVDLLLGFINAMTTWTLRVERPDIEQVDTTYGGHYKIGSYVILVGGTEDLEQQRDELMSKTAWSSQARFLVVVKGKVDSPESLALSIVQELWYSSRVLQVVVIVKYQLYTWFPYQHCSTSNEIVQVDEWSTLFPDKTLSKRHGCELTVGTTPVEAHVIELGNDSFWGLEIEYLHLLQHALNFTVKYRKPGPGNNFDRHFEILQDLQMGRVDVILGDFPLHLHLMQLADPTVPYLDSSLKWFVPCARQASRVKTVMRLYTASVWAALGGILLLTSGCIWLLGRRSHQPPSLSRVLQDVWALALGVSLPQLPHDSRLRALFVLLIWYFLAISTIFQTLITSVLVDPGRNKQIATFEELQHSRLKYCIHPDTERYINTSGPYLADIKLHKEKNLDMIECTSRVLLEDDMATVAIAYLPEYFALAELGTRNKICTLEENVFQISYTMYVTKGSPLLDKFNRVIRRMLEAGVMQKLWDNMKEAMRKAGVLYACYGKRSKLHRVPGRNPEWMLHPQKCSVMSFSAWKPAAVLNLDQQ